jgi:TolB-like protein
MRRALPLVMILTCLVALSRFGSRAAAGDASPTIAVLYFDYTGKTAELEGLRKGMAQMLISDLSASDAIRVVERDRIEEVLAELKLGASGKVDARTAAKAGKLLGARYLVLGGYFDLAGALRVDARIVEVETGKVVKSLGANAKPGDFLSVEQTIALGLGTFFTASAGPAAAGHAAADKQPKPPAMLSTKTAVKYGEALAMVDRGERAKAKAALTAVVQEQPDFALASLDLDRLMK